MRSAPATKVVSEIAMTVSMSVMPRRAVQEWACRPMVSAACRPMACGAAGDGLPKVAGTLRVPFASWATAHGVCLVLWSTVFPATRLSGACRRMACGVGVCIGRSAKRLGTNRKSAARSPRSSQLLLAALEPSIPCGLESCTVLTSNCGDRCRSIRSSVALVSGPQHPEDRSGLQRVKSVLTRSDKPIHFLRNTGPTDASKPRAPTTTTE